MSTNDDQDASSARRVAQALVDEERWAQRLVARVMAEAARALDHGGTPRTASAAAPSCTAAAASSAPNDDDDEDNDHHDGPETPTTPARPQRRRPASSPHASTSTINNNNNNDSASGAPAAATSAELRGLRAEVRRLSERLAAVEAEVVALRADAAAATAASPAVSTRDWETCVVCMDAPSNAGFEHGESVHRCVCRDCADRDFTIAGSDRARSRCPVCRAPIERVLNIF
jgi:hypothetical protein